MTIQELTATDAGLTDQQQIDIALRLMLMQKNGVTTTEICIEIEKEMEGAKLSSLGRDKLRELLNTEVLPKGWVKSPRDNKGLWLITAAGEKYITESADPEGIDKSNFDMGDYPIDSLLIRSEQRTVFDVVRRMGKGQFILDPDFQRDFVWDLAKQSKLIESALLRLPLPVFYLAENTDGKIVVVDGLQRLTTFQRFLDGEFALRGLGGNSKELNKKRFDDLDPKLQNRIEDTQLILYLIDSKVPDRARLDIFERVNSGVALSRQQMRNSLYVGPATRWLKEQALGNPFQTATGQSLNSKTMRDREAINRFCAFYFFGVEGYRNQGGNMDEFLAQALEKMNVLGANTLDKKLSPIFERSMKNNTLIFGRHAFRKHQSPESSRNVINIALFDVYSLLMTRYSEKLVEQNIDNFRRRFYQLQRDPDFMAAITHSTNDVRNVEKRFELIEQIHISMPGDMEKPL